MTCPKCAQECARDEVHNGVGMMYGPWGCYCGWSEDSDYNSSENICVASQLSGFYVDSRGGLYPNIPQL